MRAFLLTWDGSDEGYDPRDYREDQGRTERGESVRGQWSFGTRRSGTAADDRVYLLRQHDDRGIVASGRLVDGEIVHDRHWADPARSAAYVWVEWDVVVDTAHRLPIEDIIAQVGGHNWNQVYSSGQMLQPATHERLSSRWADHLRQLGRRIPPALDGGAERHHHAATTSVLCIWSSSTLVGRDNLEFGSTPIPGASSHSR